MITASLVIYKTRERDLRKVISCVSNSIIDHLIVIDNSPTDELYSIVKELSSETEYLYGQGNVGYGRAHNIAIKKAIEMQSTYHLILNPDIYFEPHVITNLQQFADRHKDIGLLLPKVIYPNGDLQYLCKLLPTPLDIFGRRFFPEKMKEKRNSKFEMHQMGYDKVWNCPILSGCFMFLRVSELRKVEGFDDRFFMYFEDFDLMRRMHHNCKTCFYPSVEIVHNHAAEHHTSKVLLKASIKSAIQYFNKWGWIFDKERKSVNRNAFSEINHIKD